MPILVNVSKAIFPKLDTGTEKSQQRPLSETASAFHGSPVEPF
jgi:hypothetical protein